jgi:hypothetical protein
MLGVADKERGNSIPVHDIEELIDVRVENGLTD